MSVQFKPDELDSSYRDSSKSVCLGGMCPGANGQPVDLSSSGLEIEVQFALPKHSGRAAEVSAVIRETALANEAKWLAGAEVLGQEAERQRNQIRCAIRDAVRAVVPETAFTHIGVCFAIQRRTNPAFIAGEARAAQALGVTG